MFIVVTAAISPGAFAPPSSMISLALPAAAAVLPFDATYMLLPPYTFLYADVNRQQVVADGSIFLWLVDGGGHLTAVCLAAT